MIRKTTTTTEQPMIERGVTLPASVTLTVDNDVLCAWFDRYLLQEGLAFAQDSSWNTERRLTDLPDGVMLAGRISDGRQRAIVRVRGLIGFVTIESYGHVRAAIYGQTYSPGDFEAAFDQLRTWLEPRKDDVPDVVEMTFRYRSGDEQVARTRAIEAPAWADIRSNYPADVQDPVGRLMTTFEPGAGGRLVLLHGSPGTGKTYVIRALAREWRQWCTVEYIADPEAFFGDAQYMMVTLLEDPNEDKWRLLVVEDAGELLTNDAKARQGQGLSRLLNFGEGLIGQGLRVLILISTNEELRSLNEAVSRPGRTAAQIEFNAFTADEANEWLVTTGRTDLAVHESTTLAELFALVSGERITTQPKREPIGFLKG